jgi:hypothetical protein
VFGTTAHLGQGINDYGNNSFETNAIDLSYQTKAATPDTLKAEYNWWGEVNPDTSEFGGRKAYIDYDPWLKIAPGRLPVSDVNTDGLCPLFTDLVCPFFTGLNCPLFTDLQHTISPAS